MSIPGQCVGDTRADKDGVGVNDRFMEPQRAKAEKAATEHQRDLCQHHGQHKPCGDVPYGDGKAVKAMRALALLFHHCPMRSATGAQQPATRHLQLPKGRMSGGAEDHGTRPCEWLL